MKTCNTCHLELPLEHYGPDKRTKDGLWSKCFSCRGLAAFGATEKRCIMCDEMKPLDGFHKDLQSPDLHRRICATCGSKSAKNWNKQNKERFNVNQREWQKAHRDAGKSRARRYHLQNTYDITEAQYWEMFESQGRGCAICGVSPKKKNLHVDHNHKTNEVRGLLCSSCNTKLLPILEHHPDRAAAAVEYLADPPARKVLWQSDQCPNTEPASEKSVPNPLEIG